MCPTRPRRDLSDFRSAVTTPKPKSITRRTAIGTASVVSAATISATSAAGGASADAVGRLLDDLVCARVQLCLEILSLPHGFDPPADHAADWAGRAARLTAELAA